MVRRVHTRKDDPRADALVALLLTHGGPIKCELWVGALVTDQWLLTVIPNVKQHFGWDPRLCMLCTGVGLLVGGIG